MVSDTFYTLFGTLFLSVFVWFFLISRLFKLLKSAHPEKYREMGEPTLFSNNTPKTGRATMSFLLKREYAEMGDSKLSALCNAMLVFLALYIMGFLFLFFSIPFGFAP